MSNWCNRNTLEYLRYQNDPDYAGLPEWFIVAPDSSSDILLTNADGTTPRRYLFVPAGQDVVVEKSQGGKDSADAELLAQQETDARAAAVAYVESVLLPEAMANRALGQGTVDRFNSITTSTRELFQAAGQGTNYGQYRSAVLNSDAPPNTRTYSEERDDAIALINSGAVDAPAPEGT